MSAEVLVGFATRSGSTQEVAKVVATTLRDRGLEVDLRPLRNVRTLAGYRMLVLGAPLYMFRLRIPLKSASCSEIESHFPTQPIRSPRQCHGGLIRSTLPLLINE